MTPTERTHPKDRRVLSAVTLLYVAYVPFDILPVVLGRTLTGPLALLLIVTWIISSLRRHEKIIFPGSAGSLLFLYCLWIICTIFWSIDAGASVDAVQTILLQAPLLVVLSNTLGPVWLRSLVTFGCSSAVLGLVVLTRPADALRGDRANVGGVDENITAMVLTVGFAVLVYAVTHLSGRRAALLVPLALVTGAATLHTGSRAGAVSVVAVLVVALLQFFRHGRLRPAVWIRSAGILLLAYFSYTISLDAGLLPQRVVQLLSQSSGYGDGGRGAIMNLYLQSFDHWALFGVGVGNDASYLYLTQSVYRNAHNLFWRVWIETGLVGLTLFAAFLTVVIRRGFRSVASQALIPIATALAIFSMTLGIESSSLLWFVIALALTQSPAEPRSAETTQPKIGIEFLPQLGSPRGSVTN